jgi:hypothetical protein
MEEEIVTVSELIERIKDIICHRYSRRVKQSDVADCLQINYLAFASNKKRNTMPYKNVLLF